ncbi:hypothetical protein P7C70_g6216, partial [Phenoliferia sp. Uapishka_3]
MSVGTVVLDDFSSLFSYSGPWTVPDTSPVGFPGSDAFLETLVDGTFHQASVVGSSVTLNFSGESYLPNAFCQGHAHFSSSKPYQGPSVSLYGVSGPSGGFYDISLDGGATSAPLSASSSTNTSGYLLYSVESLPNGPHSVTLTNLGADAAAGSVLMLDYALVTSTFGAAGQTLMNTTVDDLDKARLTYTGAWTSNNDTRFLDGTSSYTSQDGGSVSMSFNGSAVYIYGDTVSDHGLFLVKLDNSTYEYNAKTTNLKIGTLLFFAGDLDLSLHSLTVTNVGSTFFDLDYIIYTTPSNGTTSGAVSSVRASGASGVRATSSSSHATGTAATPTSSVAKSSSTSKRGPVLLFTLGLLATTCGLVL